LRKLARKSRSEAEAASLSGKEPKTESGVNQETLIHHSSMLAVAQHEAVVAFLNLALGDGIFLSIATEA
jgi:hypothetical protein